MKCELCGRDETECDIGDWHGVLACAECAEKEPELVAWRDRIEAQLYGGEQ